MTKIVLDCYGGDNAPDEIIKGCRLAADELHVQIVLTGKGRRSENACHEKFRPHRNHRCARRRYERRRTHRRNPQKNRK